MADRRLGAMPAHADRRTRDHAPVSSDDSRRPLSRIISVGARGADRVAEATGVNAAIDDAVEEAIVRALRSPALRQGLERALLEAGTEIELDPDEVAALVRRVLASEVADEIWAEILSSRQAQMLVERIADAPEVRAAIAAQGVGLIGDIGDRLSRLTEALDDAIERVTRRHAQAIDLEAGLATRTLAGAIDIALLFALYSVCSSIVSSVVTGIDRHPLSLLAITILSALAVVVAGGIIATLWALVGQTPGMRFLSVRIVHEGSHELGMSLAIRRLLALLLALVPFGLGWLWIARDPRRRGWHDRISGTEVVHVRRSRTAPHATRDPA